MTDEQPSPIKLLTRLGLILALPILVSIFTFVYIQKVFNQPADPTSTKIEIIEIAPGTPFKQTCKNLQARGLLKRWWTLDVLSRLKDADKKISAGEYELTAAMSPKDILAKLVSGEVFKRVVVLKEGYSIWELGDIVEEAGILPAAEINKILHDPNMISKAGIGADSFEGYLFPNTYHFSRPVSAEVVVWTFLEEGERHWKPEFTNRAIDFDMSRHDILTLASIIEKESGNAEEQPTISAVFHNRLKNNMRLESDPTVVYGIPNFDGIIHRSDLDRPSPYNTYQNFGLPPGPICNPGMSAIKAALYPTEGSQYLFFVADGRGGHIFSATLAEHNKAVGNYREIERERKQGEPEPAAPAPQAPAPETPPAAPAQP